MAESHLGRGIVVRQSTLADSQMQSWQLWYGQHIHAFHYTEADALHEGRERVAQLKTQGNVSER